MQSQKKSPKEASTQFSFLDIICHIFILHINRKYIINVVERHFLNVLNNHILKTIKDTESLIAVNFPPSSLLAQVDFEIIFSNS